MQRSLTPEPIGVLAPNACNVVELRRYALRPGKRDTLVELFDSEFVETQEAEGMCILGQFRGPRRPRQLRLDARLP